jgi:Mrp family chromosome partitioning ATPase
MRDQAERLREMANQVRQQIEAELLQPHHSRVVAISSGKGGVGKSTLALNLALVLCAQGKRVLLLDADMGMANLDIMLGMVPKYNLFHMIQGKRKLEEIIIPGPQGMSIIPGVSRCLNCIKISVPLGGICSIPLRIGAAITRYSFSISSTRLANITFFSLYSISISNS